MMVWEYKIIKAPRIIMTTDGPMKEHLEKWEAMLNKLGSDGWEHYGWGEGFHYFKRCL